MASMAATRSFAFCTSSPAPSFRCPNTKYAQSQSFLRLNFRLLKQNHRKLNVVQASAPGLYSADQFELTSGNVDKVLDNVRPYLIADGGNVDVVSVEDGVVSLKLQGTPRPFSYLFLLHLFSACRLSKLLLDL
ncbi:UNVERIFIED_CONTAM: NifU-like protein 1, chloroplastic [Sesamum calycinum]|uniref:NifU-like protein 1, chloroplastic n=1 Tax=Sesamum calycinum TaxID=2727403 RepID=A0AAW2SBE3_9LAMI